VVRLQKIIFFFVALFSPFLSLEIKRVIKNIKRRAKLYKCKSIKKSKLNKNNNPCMVSDRSISAQEPKIKQNFLHLILLYGDIRTKKQQKKIIVMIIIFIIVLALLRSPNKTRMQSKGAFSLKQKCSFLLIDNNYTINPYCYLLFYKDSTKKKFASTTHTIII